MTEKPTRSNGNADIQKCLVVDQGNNRSVSNEIEAEGGVHK